MVGQVQGSVPNQNWENNRFNNASSEKKGEREALIGRDTIQRSPDALLNEVEERNSCLQNLCSKTLKFLASIPRAVSQFCNDHCMEDERNINDQVLDEPEVTDCYMQ